MRYDVYCSGISSYFSFGSIEEAEAFAVELKAEYPASVVIIDECE